jgi:hypothetical protein
VNGPAHALDAVAWVTVRLHQNGALSTQGTIGDPAMAIHMLEQAIDAIRREVVKKDRAIVIPGRDVDVMPSIPTRDIGDMAPHERGDP